MASKYKLITIFFESSFSLFIVEIIIREANIQSIEISMFIYAMRLLIINVLNDITLTSEERFTMSVTVRHKLNRMKHLSQLHLHE
jgi:hypothetical protein